MNLQSSITELKGIGEKTSLPFAKVGIHTVLDLLEYYPRDYEIYEEPVKLTEIESGKKYAVHGFVESVSEVKRFGKYQIFSARLRVGEQVLQATWFNVPFLRRVFQRGSQYIFRGIIAEKNGQYRLEQPEHFTLADYDKLLYMMQPRYPLTTGLTEKMVVKSVHQIIDGGQVYVPEYLPENMRREYDLESEWDAMRQVHFPANEQVMRQARKRIVFDEFLLFILGIRRMKEQQEELVNEMPMVEVSETARLIEALPYELTGCTDACLAGNRIGCDRNKGYEPSGAGRCGLRQDDPCGAGADHGRLQWLSGSTDGANRSAGKAALPVGAGTAGDPSHPASSHFADRFHDGEGKAAGKRRDRERQSADRDRHPCADPGKCDLSESGTGGDR